MTENELKTQKEEEMEIKIRHLHSHIEELDKQLEVTKDMIYKVACMFAERLAIPDNELEKSLETDLDLYESLNDLYSPIDEKDKINWMKKRNIRF